MALAAFGGQERQRDQVRGGGIGSGEGDDGRLDLDDIEERHDADPPFSRG